MIDDRCPVLVVTGELGAGKTTLVNRLLAQADGRRITVIENEAGEVGIDVELLVGAADVLDLPDGCACCTVRGALSGGLEEMASRVAGIDAVIVELSGLAEPLPVLGAFQEPAARAAFRVAALVGVVSAAAPTEGWLWGRQLRFVDTAVISRLAPGDRPPPALVEAVRAAAPHWTRVLPAAVARLDDLIAAERPGAEPPDDEAHHHHGAIDAEPVAVTVELDGDVDRDALDRWLTGEIAAAGDDLLRVKGISATAGASRRYLVGLAHGRWDAHYERPWLGPRRTRIVFIGHRLDRERLQAGLRRCSGGRPRRAAADAAQHHVVAGQLEVEPSRH